MNIETSIPNQEPNWPYKPSLKEQTLRREDLGPKQSYQGRPGIELPEESEEPMEILTGRDMYGSQEKSEKGIPSEQTIATEEDPGGTYKEQPLKTKEDFGARVAEDLVKYSLLSEKLHGYRNEMNSWNKPKLQAFITWCAKESRKHPDFEQEYREAAIGKLAAQLKK